MVQVCPQYNVVEGGSFQTIVRLKVLAGRLHRLQRGIFRILVRRRRHTWIMSAGAPPPYAPSGEKADYPGQAPLHQSQQPGYNGPPAAGSPAPMPGYYPPPGIFTLLYNYNSNLPKPSSTY